MGESAGTSATASPMVFEPILEEGVFRFDSSADARNEAFPSLSFVNQKDRDTPIMSNHKIPSYIPTSEYVSGQQVVSFEVSFIFLKFHILCEILAMINYISLTLTNMVISFLQEPHFMEQVKLVDSLKEQEKGLVSNFFLS